MCNVYIYSIFIMLTSNKNKKKIVPNNPKPVNISDFLSFDNIWKLAILAFMIASLYLQNNFITKSEYQKTSEKVQRIELILGQLEIKNQIDISQTKTLELIEIRLRQLEQMAAIVESRLNEKRN
jgi:hypothetical protein